MKPTGSHLRGIAFSPEAGTGEQVPFQSQDSIQTVGSIFLTVAECATGPRPFGGTAAYTGRRGDSGWSSHGSASRAAKRIIGEDSFPHCQIRDLVLNGLVMRMPLMTLPSCMSSEYNSRTFAVRAASTIKLSQNDSLSV